MAPMKQDNMYSSSSSNSHYYSSPSPSTPKMEAVDILASCYLVSANPSQAQLKGLHYCATGVTGAEWYS